MMTSKGEIKLLKILQIIFSILFIAFAWYGLLTDDYQFQPYMMVFMGLTMLVMGIGEFKKGQKFFGWFNIFVFVFILVVFVKNFIN